MYADDTTVFCTGSSHGVACNLLNCALEELFTWCINNRLTPHPGKCEVMLLSKARLIGPLPAIYIGNPLLNTRLRPDFRVLPWIKTLAGYLI